jgi:GMP synthase (glutamine-hydrolysing)
MFPGLRQAVAIRHVGFEDLGSYQDVLGMRGYQVTYLDAGLFPVADLDPLEPDLLVILGGPIGAHDEDRFPFLRQELELLEARLAAPRPTLGICLGAQLLARALGATVQPGPVELGWKPLSLTAAGRSSPLRHLKPDNTQVLHWHGDTFDLPAGTEHWAATDTCAHQAFAYGSHTLGLQFHPEVTAPGLERWLIGHFRQIEATEGVTVNGLREATRRHAPGLQPHAAATLNEWLQGAEKYTP